MKAVRASTGRDRVQLRPSRPAEPKAWRWWAPGLVGFVPISETVGFAWTRLGARRAARRALAALDRKAPR